MTHAIECGVSREDITPEAGPALQGHFGAPASRAVLRPLEVRAIVFTCGDDRAAVATVDAIGVTRQITDRIRQAVTRTCGIPGDRVMIACSHTHCAPATLPCMGLSPSANWIAHVEHSTASCIARAAGDMCRVALGLGCGAVHFNRTRRPQSGRTDRGREHVDRRARVLRIDRNDGSRLATLFHYACHPTTISGERGLISPDYPGAARDVIEAATGGTALFLQGSSGDLRPELDDPETSDGVARGRLDEYGRLLGDEVCRVAQDLTTSGSTSLRASRVDVAIPFGDPPSRDTLRTFANDQSEVGRGLMAPWACRVLEMLETETVPRHRATEMQAISIGPLTLLAIPGEPLQAIGTALEERCQELSSAGAVWPVGYANDMVGYLCTERQYAEGGYEPGAYPFFAEPAPFRGEERALLNAASRLLRP